VHIDIVPLLLGVVAFTSLACIVVAGILIRPRSTGIGHFTRIGAHSLTGAKRRAAYSRLRVMLRRLVEAAPRADPPPGPVDPVGTGRVVRSHHVLCDRLMDAPTGRLHPSPRHRVPPWVLASGNFPASLPHDGVPAERPNGRDDTSVQFG
jgi:hypothetical protein